jgi:mediator of RNA polymerase II transcription subunit 16
MEGKSALICLTRNGSLRLLHQVKGTAWSEVTVELDDAAFAAEYLFTHAAFAPDQGIACPNVSQLMG